GVKVVNVSNPAMPQVVLTIPLAARALDLVVNGSTLYVADTTTTAIIDITTPASAAVVGTIPAAVGTVFGVASAGTRLYVLDGATVRVYTLASPGTPTVPSFAGSVANNHASVGLTASATGTTAYR